MSEMSDDTDMWMRTKEALAKLKEGKKEKANVRETLKVEDSTRKPSMLFAIEHSVDVYDRSNSGKQRDLTPEKISKRKEMERTFGDQIRRRVYPGKRFVDSSPITLSQHRSRRKRKTTTLPPKRAVIVSESHDTIIELQNELVSKNDTLKTLRQTNKRISGLAARREVRIRELEAKCRTSYHVNHFTQRNKITRTK